LYTKPVAKAEGASNPELFVAEIMKVSFKKTTLLALSVLAAGTTCVKVGVVYVLKSTVRLTPPPAEAFDTSMYALFPKAMLVTLRKPGLVRAVHVTPSLLVYMPGLVSVVKTYLYAPSAK
jgi:hypothetical protein